MNGFLSRRVKARAQTLGRQEQGRGRALSGISQAGRCERLKDQARFGSFANLLTQESRYRPGILHAAAGEQVRQTLHVAIIQL